MNNEQRNDSETKNCDFKSPKFQYNMEKISARTRPANDVHEHIRNDERYSCHTFQVNRRRKNTIPLVKKTHIR